MERCIRIACMVICFAVLVGSVASCSLVPTAMTPDPCSHPDPVLDLGSYGGTFVMLEADFSQLPQGQSLEGALQVTANTIQRRLDIYGLSDGLVRYGSACARIAVEVPRVNLTDEDISIITVTALLEFRELVVGGDGEAEWVPAAATIDGQEKALTSAYFKENTYVGQGNQNQILLFFEWNEEGSKISAEVTGRLIGQPLAIFLNGEPLLGEDGQPIAPIVRSQITDRGQIEGFSLSEATELSQLINAGRMPVILLVLKVLRVAPDTQ